MTPSSDDKCLSCDQTRGWHEENKPIHPFNDGSAGATAFLGRGRNRDTPRRGSDAQRAPEAPQKVVWPTDPVLRVALITTGVITADDLRNAEDMLKASMGLGGSSGGESPAEARRGEVQVGAPASVDVGNQSGGSQEVGAQPEHQQG